MKRQDALNIVSKLLEIAGDVFSNHGCNDLPDDFFTEMSEEDIQDLYKEWHMWNGDPEEYDPESIGYLGDVSLMTFFSDYIKEI